MVGASLVASPPGREPSRRVHPAGPAWLRYPGLPQPETGCSWRCPACRPGAGGHGPRVLAPVPWRSSTTSWSLLSSHDCTRIRSLVRDADLIEVAAGLLFTMPRTPMVFAGDELGLESEQRRLLVLAARAEHGPLRLPTGALGWPARHRTCTATPTPFAPTPTAT